MLKKFLTLSALGAVALFSVSCSSYSPHAKNGAVLGGVLGAGVGALVGEHKNNELEGAAVGGLLGAIAGGALGSSQDDYERARRYPVQQQPVSYAPAYPSGAYPPSYYRTSSSVNIGVGSYYPRYRSYGGYGRGYSRGYNNCVPVYRHRAPVCHY